MSYVYYSSVKRINEKRAFEVGHHKPTGEFVRESVWDTREEATAQVSFLNGGKPLEYSLFDK